MSGIILKLVLQARERYQNMLFNEVILYIHPFLVPGHILESLPLGEYVF